MFHGATLHAVWLSLWLVRLVELVLPGGAAQAATRFS